MFLLFSGWSYDDPFITYRYAENLRLGLGFVYNSGDRVLSTTTPLFTVLLAAAGTWFPDVPRVANLIGAISLPLGAIAIYSLAEEWEPRAVGWAGLLLYPTFPLLLNTLGSEMALYIALCLWAFAFYAQRRYNATALCSALAFLTRADGVLVALLLAADYVLHRPRRVPWSALFIFLGLTLPWMLFAWAYFGSPVPVTLAAKQHQGAMLTSQQFAPGLLTIIGGYAPKLGYWLEGAMALLGIIFTLGRNRHWILFLLWPAAYAAAYSALGVSRYFWYYAPLVPGLVVLVGVGMQVFLPQTPSTLVAQDSPRFGRIHLGSAISGRMVRLLPKLAFAALLSLFITQGVHLLEMRQAPDERIEIYRSIGQWLEANTPVGSTIGTLETGVIGYYARRRMVDFAGLIQPDVANRLTAETTYEDAAIWAIQRYHPEYIVLQEDIMPRLEQEYVWYHCWPAQYFSGKSHQYPAGISIFFCPETAATRIDKPERGRGD